MNTSCQQQYVAISGDNIDRVNIVLINSQQFVAFGFGGGGFDGEGIGHGGGRFGDGDDGGIGAAGGGGGGARGGAMNWGTLPNVQVHSWNEEQQIWEEVELNQHNNQEVDVGDEEDPPPHLIWDEIAQDFVLHNPLGNNDDDDNNNNNNNNNDNDNNEHWWDWPLEEEDDSDNDDEDDEDDQVSNAESEVIDGDPPAQVMVIDGEQFE